MITDLVCDVYEMKYEIFKVSSNLDHARLETLDSSHQSSPLAS